MVDNIYFHYKMKKKSLKKIKSRCPSIGILKTNELGKHLKLLRCLP